jgi:serine/threonine protein kinase
VSGFSQLERRLGPYGLLPLDPVRRRPFSLVFPARQPGSSRELFVKVLLSDKAGIRRNFGREIEILRTLGGQPGVAPLVVASTTDLVFHACDRVRGRDLVEIAQAAERRDLGALLRLGCALARWIDALHRLGIAHRDLSPDHVLVEPDGGLVIVDFGMAKVTRELAPEERRACEGYDVQALGMILWEMICGRAIFPYRQRALSQVLQREAALVEAAGLPSEVRRLLLGCLGASSEFAPDRGGFAGAEEALRAFAD